MAAPASLSALKKPFEILMESAIEMPSSPAPALLLSPMTAPEMANDETGDSPG
jgi:hypothetical protein